MIPILLTMAAAPPPKPAPRFVPTVFAPGIISTRDYERDGTFTPDGRSFYFTKRTIWPYFSAICVSHLRGGRWSEPAVAPFSGRYSDATPSVSPDGAHLYFASRRPVDESPKRDYDLWVVDRVGVGWGEPHHLPAPINGPSNQLSPSVTRSGTLYFITDAPAAHVARAEQRDGVWLPPAPVGDSAGGGAAELSAYVDPAERYLIVSVVGRADAIHSAEGVYPRADLYLRERRNQVWSPLRHLPPPINSAANEGSPTVTPDGKYLVFTSERGRFTEHGIGVTYEQLERSLHDVGNGLGDIYRVDIRALELRP
ncbi:MAG: hypothetical protein ABI647_17165 [Gemmatimonadota bacterium]